MMMMSIVLATFESGLVLAALVVAIGDRADVLRTNAGTNSPGIAGLAVDSAFFTLGVSLELVTAALARWVGQEFRGLVSARRGISSSWTTGPVGNNVVVCLLDNHAKIRVQNAVLLFLPAIVVHDGNARLVLEEEEEPFQPGSAFFSTTTSTPPCNQR